MKKVFALLIVGMFCITLVSAVWWNPFTWWDDPINSPEQEGKLFIINGEPKWNVIKHTQEIDYDDDGLPDVISTFTEINETLIEVFVDDTREHGGYKWESVICNISGINNIEKLEYNPSTEVWTNTGSLNYQNLQYTHPEGWCDETGGYGFILFGSGSGNRRYRLILPEGEKELEILAGDGTEKMVIEYQNVSTLFYNLSFGQANITLFKNISGTYNNTVNNLFIYYNNDSYKFGADDNSEENGTLNSYKYQIKSNIPIGKKGDILFLTNPEQIVTEKYKYFEQHDFDFEDICSRGFNPTYENITTYENFTKEWENYTTTTYDQTADCKFNSYQILDDYFYDVIFISDKFIDPEITIGSSVWITTSILTNVTTESGDANFTHLSMFDPKDSLISYWNFDGDSINETGTTAYDFNVFDNDGVLTSTTVVNSNNCMTGFGNCVQIDGTGADVAISMFPKHNLTGQSFTVSLWFKLNVVTGSGYFRALDEWNGDGGSTAFFIRADGDFPIVQMDWTPGTGNFFGPRNSVNVGQWNHVLYTYNGTYEWFYVNNDPNTRAQTGVLNSGIHAMNLGDDWNGTIDEFMIWNRSFTVAEVDELFNNQSARFFPTGTMDITTQSILNISSGNNKVNVTTTIQNNRDSQINLTLGYYDGTWKATNPQIVVSDTILIFDITTATTNLTLNYTFLAGNQTTFFYSPIIQDNITLEAFNVAVGDTCTYTSGDWNVDCSDNCVISSPVDVGGNDIFISGTGTFITLSDIINYGLLRIQGTDASNICRVRCEGGCFR